MKLIQDHRHSGLDVCQRVRLYFCCSQGKVEAKRWPGFWTGNGWLQKEGGGPLATTPGMPASVYTCTFMLLSSVVCICNTRGLWSFFPATDLLSVSRGQLTHRDSRRRATRPLGAWANTDKITGYWIKCNFVLTGPADKARVGFERTSPGFKHSGNSVPLTQWIKTKLKWAAMMYCIWLRIIRHVSVENTVPVNCSQSMAVTKITPY